ncbi:hypothetical protein CHARACLAT_031397 [Characodon lateralis]|uniref:Uncharacterized protein n=1 Tax=Characodon lateralis TaxID=208331 RepID=A0ABU7ES69_9TELE|nr:hypothetical protein [Characodon lateralis]
MLGRKYLTSCHFGSASSPDDVIIVAQEELLSVFPGVVDHTHPSYKVNHLLPCRVVQVVPALVAPVTVDPLQPELAARRRFIRHVGFQQHSTSSEHVQSDCWEL